MPFDVEVSFHYPPSLARGRLSKACAEAIEEHVGARDVRIDLGGAMTRITIDGRLFAKRGFADRVLRMTAELCERLPITYGGIGGGTTWVDIVNGRARTLAASRRTLPFHDVVVTKRNALLVRSASPFERLSSERERRIHAALYELAPNRFHWLRAQLEPAPVRVAARPAAEQKTFVFSDFGPAAATFAELGADGGGYGWHGVVDYLVRTRAPKIRRRVSFDAESSELVVSSADASALACVEGLIREALTKPALLKRAIRNADRSLME